MHHRAISSLVGAIESLGGREEEEEDYNDEKHGEEAGEVNNDLLARGQDIDSLATRPSDAIALRPTPILERVVAKSSGGPPRFAENPTRTTKLRGTKSDR